MKQAQSLVEYGLIMGLIALVAISILSKFSSPVNNVGKAVNSAVSNNSMSKFCADNGKTLNTKTNVCE